MPPPDYPALLGEQPTDVLHDELTVGAESRPSALPALCFAADDILTEVTLGDLSEPANTSCNVPTLVATATFDFTLGDQQFSLGDGESKTFAGLAPGVHRLTEQVPSGWHVGTLSCQDATDDTAVERADGSAVVDLAEGETVTCTYTNVADPPPPAQPPPDTTLFDTGAPPWTSLVLALGLLLVSGGIGLAVSARRTSTH